MTPLERWTRWCLNTCLLHGIPADVAAAVTAKFSRGVAPFLEELQ